MNIIIPLGGKSLRFLNEGYTTPKAMIKIFNKTMIQHVLDNISVDRDDKIYIIYHKILNDYEFVSFMYNHYPTIRLIRLEHDTSGASETLMIGLRNILHNVTENDGINLKKCMVLDCDTFYTEDIINIFRKSQENMVFYTKKQNEPPIYSYILLDETSHIIDIAEKQKISDNANTGAYAFNDIEELYKYCKYVIENKNYSSNEPYTSCVIHQMLQNNCKFKGYELNSNQVFSLGTPTELTQYMNNTFAFLFDLDGTMVITDNIYFDVWSKILSKYNIKLTNDIFQKYIQGNNDKRVVNTLLPNIVIDLNELSREKDSRFIENIDKLKKVDGIEDMLNMINHMGHKCCIVTNCNRTVANAIVNHLGIKKYIDFIISGDECTYGKPSPMPYLKAILQYDGIKNEKCFIFEDSKSGILSGKSVNPKCLIGMETTYTADELINYGVNITLKNYTGPKKIIDNLINSRTLSDINKIKQMIKKSLLIDISEIDDIIIDDNKLKGGFIADVISVIIKEKNNMHKYVLKHESTSANSLSNMAKQLDLYEREYYFY